MWTTTKEVLLLATALPYNFMALEIFFREKFREPLIEQVLLSTGQSISMSQRLLFLVM